MKVKVPEGIRKKLQQLPRRPGVYLMKDERGRIIYVGKAMDLRQRVRSYFQGAGRPAPKVRAMLERVWDLEYTVTDTEMEALILECNLIKEHRPRYNINLKDDKQYPYLRLTVQETFPRLHVTRRVEKDGARYFGPYTDAGAVRETTRLIRRLFPLRCCRTPVDPSRLRRPCLNRHIGRCLAPCTGEVTKEEYRAVVDEVQLFLEGKRDSLLREIAARMAEASEKLEFEKAAQLRDQYRALEAVTERQKITFADGSDRDVVALAGGSDVAAIQLFMVRRGRLMGREHFLLTNPTGEEEPGLLAAFLRQYYARASQIPPEILLSVDVPEKCLLEQWLKTRRGSRVRLVVPRRGDKKELVRLASENASLFLEEEMLRQQARDPRVALLALAQTLALVEPPYRIEGYDVSHLQGDDTVASMVVFQGGLPKPADYRRFRVRTVDKPDDYAALREVLARRFARLAGGSTEHASNDPFLLLPDLVLIDGGPGQLGAALQTLAGLGLGMLTVVSLAKEEELLYLPGRREPLRLPAGAPALRLLQHVRDEAHRFAVTYQRTLRRHTGRGSTLLDVPGIGEKRRKALLAHFGSVAGIKKAAPEELAAVKGMDRKSAFALYEYLHR